MHRSLDQHKIEQALSFLFRSLNGSSNSKPVGLHSIRVASLLWNDYPDESLILAALLHDVVEDTNVNIEQVKENFGQEVAAIVKSCTFEDHTNNYSSKLNNAKHSIDEAAAVGNNALIVKAADFIDNANYYEKAVDNDLKQYLIQKYEYFIKAASNHLSDEPIWQHVLSTYENKVKCLR